MIGYGDGHFVRAVWIAIFGAFVALAIIVLGCVMIGCMSPSRPPREAEALVVVEAMDPSFHSWPSVVWVRPTDVGVCTGPHGEVGVLLPRRAIDAPEGACVASYLDPSTWIAMVAWPGSFHESGLAQELDNAWRYARGDERPAQDVPAEIARVATVNAMLKENGL